MDILKQWLGTLVIMSIGFATGWMACADSNDKEHYRVIAECEKDLPRTVECVSFIGAKIKEGDPK